MGRGKRTKNKKKIKLKENKRKMALRENVPEKEITREEMEREVAISKVKAGKDDDERWQPSAEFANLFSHGFGGQSNVENSHLM